MKYFYALCLFININFLNAQISVASLKDDYIINTVKKNSKKNLVFYDSYSKDEIDKYLKLIKNQLVDSFDVEEIINQPITLSNNCEEKAINSNVFILKIKLKNVTVAKKLSGEGEFIPNKVTLTYKWKFIDEYLYFIFTSRPLEDGLQQLIYIP